MGMRHLFVAQHGFVNHWDHQKVINDPPLEDRGVYEIKKLGDAIDAILYNDNDASAHIISSSAKAAVQSSKILAKKLELKDFEKISYLWTGLDAPKNSFYSGDSLPLDLENKVLDQKSLIKRLDKVMNIVSERKDKADAIIIMADIEIVKYFAGYFKEKTWGTKDGYIRLDWGKAHHIQYNHEIIPYTLKKDSSR